MLVLTCILFYLPGILFRWTDILFDEICVYL